MMELHKMKGVNILKLMFIPPELNARRVPMRVLPLMY